MSDERRKPLGMKSYGHIGHLPDSRMGPADHACDPGQAGICLMQPRDRHDRIFVQEKLDGSNVGVARISDDIVPLVRAGYVANTSPFEQHRWFYQWAMRHQDRFRAVLEDGERLCGEWLLQAHGTRYALTHEPFVAFDLMREHTRLPYPEFVERVSAGAFVTPYTLAGERPVSIAAALEGLGVYGKHGSLDPIEGAIWRVERNEMIAPGKSSERKWRVDLLCKYVRPEKQDGGYLPEMSGNPSIYHVEPYTLLTE